MKKEKKEEKEEKEEDVIYSQEINKIKEAYKALGERFEGAIEKNELKLKGWNSESPFIWPASPFKHLGPSVFWPISPHEYLRSRYFSPNFSFENENDDLQNSTWENLINDFKNRIEKVESELEKVKRDNEMMKMNIYNSSTSYNSKYKIQNIPVEIYLDTNEPTLIFGVYESVLNILKSIDFLLAFEFDAVKGSWFKRMVAKSKNAITSDEVVNRLKELEYGLEVNGILKQQSEIDKNHSEAILNILKSVESIPNVAIRIGSLLVVKLTTSEGEVSVQVRTLSIQEMYILNKRPDLLQRPDQILIALTEAINDSSPDGIKSN